MKEITAKTLQGTKIRVNPYESEKMQKLAFSLGFRWANSNDALVDMLDKPYLFFEPDLKIWMEEEDKEYFNSDPNKEIFFHDFFPEEEYDFVQPEHYKQSDGRQTIDLMIEKFGIEKTAIFCEINAFKYADRKGKKPGEDEEREAAKQKWYEDKAKELYSQL